MDVESIAVVGAGNGGHAAAADLTLAGYKVNMFEFPHLAENLSAIKKRGGIEIIGQARTGFAKLNKITTDAKEAVKGTQLMMVTLPAFAHKLTGETFAPYFEKGQTVVLNPGHTGGALEFAHVLKEKGVREKVKIAECSTLTYGGRISGPAQMNVLAMHTDVLFSAFPASDTLPIFEFMKKLYPGLVIASDVLETGLTNVNAVLHPPGMLMNAGWIEHTKGDFNFYSEGISPAVARYVEKLDEERQEIMKKFGYTTRPFVEWYYRLGYGPRSGLGVAKSVYESLQRAVEEKNVRAPPSVTHRYITEDVPFGLVPMEALAKIAGVTTPGITSCIDFASVMNATDYRSTGLTAQRMGIDGMDIKRVQELVRA